MVNQADYIHPQEWVFQALERHTDDPAADWYIKKWFFDDPIRFNVQDTPLAIVLSDSMGRRDQYVQEDTEVSTVMVHLFPRTAYRVDEYQRAARQMRAMVDRVARLLRLDPTLGNRAIDCQVMSTQYRQPGIVGEQRVYGAEMRLEIKRRVMWNALG